MKSYLGGLPRFEDIVVVAPDNGTAILEKLMNISMAEREKRREKLRLYAPLLQWGWDSTGGDALTLALGLLRTQGTVLSGDATSDVICGMV
jgi:hypothetical protein